MVRTIKQQYDIVGELVEIAQERGIAIRSPFAGNTIGPLTILFPYKVFYEPLIPQFDRTPEPDQAAIEAAGWWVGTPPSVL